ncbi:GNAT family N-acetyltransferase [Bacillus timonensis]|uniref:GNAT family N-acetyltransferase n=1 Tax=Bacillus timonensis TaxID=1033734 RepID=A0A4S3PV29_9BACI|nr:GNAT family N-acetyltransferase [Bacillus timonensis]THE13660.1 GNAT family N-acetyltransferase [Bacillus timonensis]
MLVVKQITPEMTYDLRHKVLRPHQPMETCMYDTDHQEGGFHVGAFYGGKLISIASFCALLNEDFSSRNQYRLRAMATHEEYRKLGAGREVVHFAESFLKDKGTELLWCMARTNVQGYYEKLGFRPYGKVFDYPPIGPHIVMVKKII